MKTSVYCIATTEGQADRIVRELQTVGFSNDDISVLFPDTRGSRDLGHEKHSKAPEATRVRWQTNARRNSASC
jgi:hypothetical protein